MRFFILRHGKSPSLSEARVKHDAERPLSDAGREDARGAAREIVQRGGSPVVIYHSPIKRAAQTAAEAAAILNPPKGTRPFEPLSNHTPGELLYDCLVRECGDQEFLVVGHQPQLGEMIAFLTGEEVDLRPGAVAALSTDAAGKARLLWTKNP